MKRTKMRGLVTDRGVEMVASVAVKPGAVFMHRSEGSHVVTEASDTCVRFAGKPAPMPRFVFDSLVTLGLLKAVG